MEATNGAQHWEVGGVGDPHGLLRRLRPLPYLPAKLRPARADTKVLIDGDRAQLGSRSVLGRRHHSRERPRQSEGRRDSARKAAEAPPRADADPKATPAQGAGDWGA